MKLVILDRDGTINVDSPDFIKSPAEWTPMEHASRVSRTSASSHTPTANCGSPAAKPSSTHSSSA